MNIHPPEKIHIQMYRSVIVEVMSLHYANLVDAATTTLLRRKNASSSASAADR
jgi:hypothetical protein